MVWAAASTHLIDREFKRAALWMCAGAAIAFFGFIHAGYVDASGSHYDIGLATGWRWSVGYLLCAGLFALMGALRRA
jgi:hypothetical protein